MLLLQVKFFSFRYTFIKSHSFASAFMKEKTLLKIALGCSVTGLFILLVLSHSLEVTERSIATIDATTIGDDVKLMGKVDRVTVLDKVAFIEVMKPESISVVLFKDEEQEMNIAQGDYVEIIGEIDEYEGKMQVIGNRVRVIT